ncbi:MAG: type I-E CRISPR-associated protein Cas6/Cse3/CasE, partial [Myxococcales bacterium]
MLVQSGALPDWSRLPSGYLVQSFEPNPATTEPTPFFRSGLRLRFRLRANATRRQFAG